MAAIEEIDSFFFKFKHLLISGKNANLTMKSETGKVYVNLALEVDVHPLTGARNGPSRDRRRERRALAREAFERNAAQTEEGRKVLLQMLL